MFLKKIILQFGNLIYYIGKSIYSMRELKNKKENIKMKIKMKIRRRCIKMSEKET